MKILPGQFIDTKDSSTRRFTSVAFKDSGEVVTIPFITANEWHKEWLSGLWPVCVFQDRFKKVA